VRIVVAFDSFKGCLSSNEIIKVCEAAVAEIDSSIQVCSLLIADGGEGTIDAVVKGSNGHTFQDCVTNLEGVKCNALTGVADDLYVLESAQTVGLSYSNKKNVAAKTSRGIGEQIILGIGRGFRRFAIGLGGSGTNDCGVGMLRELGFRFFDSAGKELPMDVKSFVNLSLIDDNNVCVELKDCEFTILGDVDNPLCGKHGATYTYGSQKGVKASELSELDDAIRKISEVAGKHFGKDCSNLKGAGAAGGLGYAFLQFLNADAVPGIEHILKIIKAEDVISQCDFVFTGEGKSDAQTACGKVATGIAAIAKKHEKPVIMISGALDEDAYFLHEHGIDFMTSIQDYPDALENVMKKDVAARLLSNRIKEIVRLINVVSSAK
jgi:glycerate 2-kinase